MNKSNDPVLKQLISYIFKNNYFLIFLKQPFSFRTVLDLKKNSLHILPSHSVSRNSNISHQYRTFVKINKQILIYYYSLKPIAYSDYLKPYFCSRILSRVPNYIQLSCLFSLLLAVTVFQAFLVFNDLTVLRYSVGCPSLPYSVLNLKNFTH